MRDFHLLPFIPNLGASAQKQNITTYTTTNPNAVNIPVGSKPLL